MKNYELNADGARAVFVDIMSNQSSDGPLPSLSVSERMQWATQLVDQLGELTLEDRRLGRMAVFAALSAWQANVDDIRGNLVNTAVQDLLELNSNELRTDVATLILSEIDGATRDLFESRLIEMLVHKSDASGRMEERTPSLDRPRCRMKTSRTWIMSKKFKFALGGMAAIALIFAFLAAPQLSERLVDLFNRAGVEQYANIDLKVRGYGAHGKIRSGGGDVPVFGPGSSVTCDIEADIDRSHCWLVYLSPAGAKLLEYADSSDGIVLFHAEIASVHLPDYHHFILLTSDKFILPSEVHDSVYGDEVPWLEGLIENASRSKNISDSVTEAIGQKDFGSDVGFAVASFRILK